MYVCVCMCVCVSIPREAMKPRMKISLAFSGGALLIGTLICTASQPKTERERETERGRETEREGGREGQRQRQKEEKENFLKMIKSTQWIPDFQSVQGAK